MTTGAIMVFFYAAMACLCAPILYRMEEEYSLPDTTVFLGACLWPVAGLICLGAWLACKAKP